MNFYWMVGILAGEILTQTIAETNAIITFMERSSLGDPIVVLRPSTTVDNLGVETETTKCNIYLSYVETIK